MAILNSVKILAERLKTHPEEFARGNKFDHIQVAISDLAEGKNYALWYLNAQEKDMLILALREVKRKKFEDNVLLQVLDNTEEEDAPDFGLTNIVRANATKKPKK